MDKVGVFIDINDQFFRVNKKWEGKKLNYEKLYEAAKTYGQIIRAFAYGTQLKDNADKFISCLHHIGFEAKFREVEENKWYNWAPTITMDMIRLSSMLDILILGASYPEIAPVAPYLKDKGKRIIILGCGISRELKYAAGEYVEINEEMLEGS